MHRSALNQTFISIRTFVDSDRHLRVLDLSWGYAPGEAKAHRRLFDGFDFDYRRIDVLNAARRGPRKRPRYGIPLRSNQVDVVLCSQALSHVPFFWVTLLEVARVLRPGGLAIVLAPSRGHAHGGQDCWRFYPDSFRAMAAHSGLVLKDSFTDLPKWDTGRGRLAYESVPHARYWGDSVGVLQKPARPAVRLAGVRVAARWWANRVGGLEGVPPTGRDEQHAEHVSPRQPA